MDRRSFLTAAAGLAWTATAAGAGKRRFITSDIDPLRRVLIHSPYLGAWGTVPMEDQAPAIFPDGPLGAEGATQHLRLAELLAGSRSEVVFLVQLLDEAIVRCREAGQLGEWMLGTVPWLAGTEEQLTAALLIAAAGAPVGEVLEDEPPPPPQPLRMMFFTRDFGVMTPQGLLLASFINQDRAPETALLRFALQWAPSLRRYPVAFDAAAARVYIQGGDVIVVDERTLFLGVGNLTDEAAAPKLARVLGMDVVSVQLPGGGDRRPRPGDHRPKSDEHKPKDDQRTPKVDDRKSKRTERKPKGSE
ncbi:MAG TPA: arginine deiminase family protein, partial [Isosphaeraceae bacterium]|nr:arginine deiminase family protein [Isosphaeraceae bacterium]